MSPFTLFHVAISLIAIISGLFVLLGMLGGHRLELWTAIFLFMTVATSVTGFFFFPFDGFTPAQAFGILSIILLSLAIYGRYAKELAVRRSFREPPIFQFSRFKVCNRNVLRSGNLAEITDTPVWAIVSRSEFLIGKGIPARTPSGEVILMNLP